MTFSAVYSLTSRRPQTVTSTHHLFSILYVKCCYVLFICSPNNLFSSEGPYSYYFLFHLLYLLYFAVFADM